MAGGKASATMFSFSKCARSASRVFCRCVTMASYNLLRQEPGLARRWPARRARPVRRAHRVDEIPGALFSEKAADRRSRSKRRIVSAAPNAALTSSVLSARTIVGTGVTNIIERRLGLTRAHSPNRYLIK